MNGDNSYINLCIKLIADSLNLDMDSMMQRDYEYLNKVIFEKSGIDISTATLRRIWTSDRQNIPQTKTLDALAQVLGYDGWHTFKKENPQPNNNQITFRKTRWFIVLAIMIFGGAAIWSLWDPATKIEVSLVPEKNIHEGVPATIGFNYDLSKAGNADIHIQLSWNPYERTLLDPEKTFYTGTYFYPDYHEAKLLLDDEILASAYVHITTPGWNGLIMKSGFDPNPIYVDSLDFQKGDTVSVSADLAKKYQLDALDEMFTAFTLSSEKLEVVNGDNFELKASLKNLGTIKQRSCLQTDVIVKGESGSIRVPFSSPGCYGITTLKCSEVQLPGKTHDLSRLSLDLSSPQKVILKTSNNELVITAGENEPMIIPYSNSIGSLKVIKFLFMGYGEVTEFKLSLLD